MLRRKAQTHPMGALRRLDVGYPHSIQWEQKMRKLKVPGRSLRAAVGMSLICALVGLAACEGPYMDNRHPDPQHGRFEDPGSRAPDTQGQAGQQP